MKKNVRTFVVQTPGDMSYLYRIREFIAGIATESGLAQQDIDNIELAVDEACTNIALYAYPERKGYIRLTCWLNHDDFVISIEDKGKPFNPCSVPPPELDAKLDDRKVGGLGIYFMRKFMDEISYKYDPKTGNQLTMRKHIGTDNRGTE